MLATIWKQIDELKKPSEEQKPTSTQDTNFCRECSGVKVMTQEGLPVCTECGLVEDNFVTDTPEWMSKFSEDGTVADQSRCLAPSDNADLYSQSWGKSTIISTKNANYENKRMSKINFHQSMCYKDRSLFHAYKDIDQACADLPPMVIKEAKIMYKKFNANKLTRGAIRKGIQANCVLYGCKLANFPRTTKEIAIMFNIDSKDISRTTEMFKKIMLGEIEKNYVTKPFDVITRLLNNFDVTREERHRCVKLCDTVSNCVDLMSKSPNSIASAVIYMVLKRPKGEICSACEISVPTLNKIETIIKKHLETNSVVIP
jgi:transcription initiation factor TFIIB